MWETGCRENGDFLPPGDAVHAVDGGDAGLDHLLGVDTALWVDGLAWKSRWRRQILIQASFQSFQSAQSNKSFPQTMNAVYYSQSGLCESVLLNGGTLKQTLIHLDPKTIQNYCVK